LFDSLEGTENEEFEAASRQEDDVLFYQTTSDSVAVVLGINTKAKRPTLVLLKKEPKKNISHFDGKFEKAPISEFIFANKLPLVTTFTRESANMIFDSSIKKTNPALHICQGL
jgi:protein disulfide-isomerase A1